MRHLNHNTTEPVDFIDEVIASKKAHKGDSDIINERKKYRFIKNKNNYNTNIKTRFFLNTTKIKLKSFEFVFFYRSVQSIKVYNVNYYHN